MITGLLDIIIVRFNTPRLDKRCVSSVLDYVGYSPHIITIFDNSQDKYTVTQVWNKLIRKSMGEYILLLNNDAKLTKWAIPKMMDTLLSSKDIGAVGPSTNHSKNVQRLIRYPSTRSEIDMQKEYGDKWQLSGFCLLLRRWVYAMVSGFNEEYGHYGQENELLYKIQKAGFRTMWRQDAFVHHVGQASSKNKKGFDDTKERDIAGERYKLLVTNNEESK